MAYNIKVKEFEGPLELLLNLIESRKLSINEVSLGGVTEEYFNYLTSLKNQVGESYHEEIASFLVIAATLMLIKSRSLLSGFLISTDEVADIQELEDRLKAYKAIKELAGKIGEIAARRKELYTRSAYVAITASFLPPAQMLDLENMLGLLKTTLNSIPKKNELPQKIVKKIISIEERIRELQDRIEQGMVKTFTDFVKDKTEKIEVIVSFLAMLELIKIGVIAVQQSDIFGSIAIKHGTRKNS